MILCSRLSNMEDILMQTAFAKRRLQGGTVLQNPGSDIGGGWMPVVRLFDVSINNKTNLKNDIWKE